MVTEHRMIARPYPVCRKRIIPRAVQGGRVGEMRLGSRLGAAVVRMQTGERLKRECDLHVSQGGLIGLLREAARQRAGA